MACAALVVHGIRIRRQPLPLPGSLRTLLEHQRERAQYHQYIYSVGIAPPAREIYVDQWAEWLRPASSMSSPAVALTLPEMLSLSPNAILLADPGVGKSSAIAQAVWHQSTWWLQAQPGKAPYGPLIPIVLPADLHQRDTLSAAMACQWTQVTGQRVDARAFERRPPCGEAWLVLIDGIDQVLNTTERVSVLARLGEWTAAPASPYRFLLTSRPLLGGELGPLRAEHVGRFVLRKFDPDGLRAFASQWAAFRARQHYADLDLQPITADVFMAAIRAASLVPLARIPLIATITALILENDRESALPTSRAGLYERFVAHLFTSRRVKQLGDDIPEPLALYGRNGRRAWQWLLNNLRDLLEGTAHRHLSADALGVMACAKAWAEERAPAGLLKAMPGWDDVLKGLLVSTSLIVPGPSGMHFVHPNFAEYLAAGPRSREFDLETWLADARSPDSRSLALFVLARQPDATEAQGMPTLADRLAELFLDRGGEEICIAGAIIADGIAVKSAIWDRVVDGLFDWLRDDQADASDALDTLVNLTGKAEVLDHLVAFAEDTAHPAWIRADVADELCGVARAEGVRLLRALLALLIHAGWGWRGAPEVEKCS